MPSALGNIFGGIGKGLGSLGGAGGGGIPTWMKAALGGLTGFGAVSNILADRQRGQLLNQQNQWSKLTPQQLGGRVAGATQPINAGLTQAINNIISADMAERGLSQAPGLMAAALAQGLAPAYQQNQQTALEATLAQMRQPTEAAAAGLLPRQTDLSPLLKLLLQSFQKPTMTPTGTTPPTFPNQGSWTTPSGGYGPNPVSSPTPNWFDSPISSPDFAGVAA